LGIFTASTTDNLETVRARLRAADATIAGLEGELTGAALDCAVSGDYSETDRIGAALTEAQSRAKVLRRAMQAAEAAERERLGEQGRKINATKLRSFKAHCGAIAKAGGLYQEAVLAEEAAWRAILEAAASARNLLPARRDDFVALFDGSLSRECELERSRIGRRDPALTHDPSLPGATAGAHDFWQAVPLTERLAEQLAFCGDTFARWLSLPAPPAPAPAFADPDWKPPLTPGTEAFNAIAEGREPRSTTPRQYSTTITPHQEPRI
jgi:hypothetical protein